MRPRAACPTVREMKMQKTQDLKVHRILSLLALAVGLLLMTYMIVYESEPGALPLLLVVVGGGWYVVTLARGRSGPE